MKYELTRTRAGALALAALGATALYGCGGNEPPATPSAPADTAANAPASAPTAATAEEAAKTLAPTSAKWTPEAMEELLAPVALYPDVVLGQVFVASTNPQEVLDAGNWLLQNQNLQANALDEAAKKVGFTPPIRGLLQSPEVIDMMCMQMDWTTELGQAYVNDQAGVLAAVQRLRAQAKDVGNLQSSEQLKVETKIEGGNQVVTVSPPSPQVVYVPQYDPVAVYAPPPQSTAPTTTTATTTTGHSTAALVTTGLLAFGAGILVNEVFSDDDDDYYHSGYYSPNYYGRPGPYYPPYPYRPSYGGGFYPGNDYRRPPGYQHGFNNNTVVVNQNNNYWNRYDNKSGANRGSRTANSPITAAKPNRPELASLNAKSNEPKRAAPQGPDAWKGQSSYGGGKQNAGGKVADARPASSKSAAREVPKVQGSYAGASPQARDTSGKVASAKPPTTSGAKSVAKSAAPTVSKPAAKPAAKPASNVRTAEATDRGRATPAAGPAKAATASRDQKPTAVSGASRGASDKAASQRGKQSMPSGVPPKAKAPSGKAKR